MNGNLIHAALGSRGRESDTHCSEKEAIAEMLTGGGSFFIHHDTGIRVVTLVLELPSDVEVVVECAYPSLQACWDVHRYCAEHGEYPDMIFDIGLLHDGKLLGAVEVMKSHWLDDRKVRKLMRDRIGCVGVGVKGHELRTIGTLEAPMLILPPGNRMPIRTP